MTTYSEAPQVQAIAEKLVLEHHEHLDGIEVRYVFRDEAAKEGGKTVFGKARKKSGLDAFLAAQEDELEDPEDFFVIEIALDVWSVLNERQRVALVDHELAHCRTKIDEKGNLSLVIAPHDVEEFSAIVERHGLWRPDIEEFLAAANRGATLFDDAAGAA